jgi:hypothetical protein
MPSAARDPNLASIGSLAALGMTTRASVFYFMEAQGIEPWSE